MAETTNTEYPRSSPEEIWAILREAARRQEEDRERMREADRRYEEDRERMREAARQQEEDRERMRKDRERMREEADREFKEMRKETEKLMKENQKIIGKLGNRFGEMVEHMIVPNIKEKFNELGFFFERSQWDLKISEPGNPNTLAEIDILLENGDLTLAIEVKSKPKQGDVDDLLRKMGVLRSYANRKSDHRKFLGAIAGAIMDDSVRAYALKSGFYVVEQSGDTVRIVNPEGFKPREWSFGD